MAAIATRARVSPRSLASSSFKLRLRRGHRFLQPPHRSDDVETTMSSRCSQHHRHTVEEAKLRVDTAKSIDEAHLQVETANSTMEFDGQSLQTKLCFKIELDGQPPMDLRDRTSPFTRPTSSPCQGGHSSKLCFVIELDG